MNHNCILPSAFSIGGYFELEHLRYEEYHKDAIKLNTGRNCLEYILRARKYRKVYIPYYTCEVILEPFKKLDVEYAYYQIDDKLEIVEDNFNLQEDEALLYTNYYGLKQSYVEDMVYKYGKQIIVDNTQAFYAKPIDGIDTFYTCRKFFGVPDGAYLYINTDKEFELERDVSYHRMTSLLKRLEFEPEAGYQDFRDVSHGLIGQPIKRMSKLTECLMQSIDYASASKQRRANYLQLHKALQDSNQLNFVLEDNTVPMVYPYMISDEELRERLIKNRIFVARYWPNVLEWASKGSVEYSLALNLLPLPIDQRYRKNEMDYIINTVLRS